MRTLPILAAFLIVGCSSPTGTVETSVSSSPLTRAQPELTGEAHLMVRINEVAIHVDDGDDPGDEPGDEPGMDDPASGDTSWSTLFAGSTELDLYDTGRVAKFLSASPAPAGRVTQVRLVLADDPTLTIDGQAFPVSCPSCTETGLKIVPHGQLEVPAGGTLFLTLDFDQDASLHSDGSGGFVLRPTVHL